jgi:nitric oxide reductase activation protein
MTVQFSVQRWTLRFQSLLRVTLVFLLTAVLPSASQSGPLQFPQPSPLQQKPGREDESRIQMEKDMAKKANQERQANLKRDTEKLLKLAAELKESVDKTSESTLSVDVVKKAEEIEKLAHSVKDKMKGAY